MKINAIALAAVATAAWWLMRSHSGARRKLAAANDGARTTDFEAPNAGEDLQRSHAMGANEGIGRALPQTEANTERLGVLGSEPPADSESERITPGLPDYLRGG